MTTEYKSESLREKLCDHWCGWCYSCVWWQVGVCVSRWGLGDASCCCWSWSPLSVLTSTRSLSCYLWAQACHCHPVPALSHNTFISRPSVSQYPAPHHTTSVISTSGPTSLRLLTRTSRPHGQGDCGVQVILSVSNDSSLWHFLNLEKRFESEPSSQEEVKFSWLRILNFMAPIMIIYGVILISYAAKVFEWKYFSLHSDTKFNQIMVKPVAFIVWLLVSD